MAPNSHPSSPDRPDDPAAPATPRETCDECRFDSDAYSDLDVGGTLRALTPWWRTSLTGREAVAFERPSPTTWSAYEYATHSTDILDLLGLAAAIVADQDGVEFPVVTVDPVTNAPAAGDASDLETVVAKIETLALRLDAFVAGGALASPHRARFSDGTVVDVGGVVRHAIHDALHHLRDINRGFVALGAGTPPHVGSVEAINVSKGGVPKRSVDAATIGYRGLNGDRQAARQHHGRVFQAVCLWSAEVIESLQVDGHPIATGAAGENLTLRGVDWPALHPGTRMRVGTATIELSVPAVPCAKNAAWFTDRDFGRIHPDRWFGGTRWYASVLLDGEVHVGDTVDVEGP